MSLYTVICLYCGRHLEWEQAFILTSGKAFACRDCYEKNHIMRAVR